MSIVPALTMMILNTKHDDTIRRNRSVKQTDHVVLWCEHCGNEFERPNNIYATTCPKCGDIAYRKGC